MMPSIPDIVNRIGPEVNLNLIEGIGIIWHHYC